MRFLLNWLVEKYYSCFTHQTSSLQLYALGDCLLTSIPVIVSIFLDAPEITHISDSQTLHKEDQVTLNCTADGNPAPNITWTRVSDNSSVTFPLTITGKQDEGTYRCTADNGVGSPVTRDTSIVHRECFFFR